MQDEPIDLPKLPDPPKFAKGKQPRNLQDRSKYPVHQSRRERLRRLCQLGWPNPGDPLDLHLPYPQFPPPTEADMEAVIALHDEVTGRAKKRSTEGRPDTPLASEV